MLDGVRVPKENVLGEVGKGYKYAIEILNEGRVGIGAQMIGLAQGALDRTLPYLHERQQFGSAVMGFQGVQHQIAQLATELHAARLVVYNAARMKEAGVPVVQEAAMAKLIASQVAERVASKCIELLGGVGFKQWGALCDAARSWVAFRQVHKLTHDIAMRSDATGNLENAFYKMPDPGLIIKLAHLWQTVKDPDRFWDAESASE